MIDKDKFDIVTVNDDFPVVGSFAIETHSEMVNDSESVTGKRQEIEISGKLSCEEYFPIIDSLETKRYKVSGITVHTEGFVSESNMIDYIFTAETFLVKIGDPNAG